MKLALNYAHRKDVTLVSALGNEHDNLVACLQNNQPVER